MESSVHVCAARPYPVSELLQLQKSLSTIVCPVNQISKHPNIAGIFQLPWEALSHPERFSIETKKLADIMKSAKSSQSTRRHFLQSSEDSEYSTKSELHQTQWNLRRRETSDQSSQPHSAPSGLIAQQSENFRRFYRAVASPTHVRVTAGGRIVPNTRVVAPPPYEWSAEKFCFEPRHPFQDGPSNLRRIPWPQISPLSARFPPLLPGGLISSYKLPLQVNESGSQPATQEISGSFSSSGQRYFEEEQATKMREGSNASNSIKISPPTQFDHSKPFMYNGQFVYPVPQGFQPPPNTLPVPITMLGNPNFLSGVPNLATGFFPHQFPISVANIPNPFVFSQGQIPMSGMQSAYQEAEFISPPPCLPLPGLMQVSDFTRSQIQKLRHRLDFINNQIANNTLQVNETYMLSQRDILRNQIEALEGILQVQVGVEDNERKPLLKDDFEHNAPVSSFTSDEGRYTNQMEFIGTPLAVQDPPVAVLPVESYQISEWAKHDDAQALPMSIEETAQVESRSKSRLPAASAMAPPFQPRTREFGMKPDRLTGSAMAPSTEHANHKVHAQFEGRTSLGMSSNRIKASPTAKLHPTLERARSHHEEAAQILDEVLPSTFQRSSTFHSHTEASMALNTTIVNSRQSLPYLVGKLPTGVTETNGSAHDLVYSRPLTDEEVRARYLYFGKAPRSIQSGLPKFDGKDFYPPSPAKEHAQMGAARQSPANRRNPLACLPDFENLFTELSAPGYKTPSPARSTAMLASAQSQPESIVGWNSMSRDANKNHVSTSHLDESMWSTRQLQGASLPATPPTTLLDHENKGEQDYSMLFMERGVPGYRSPLPPPTVKYVGARSGDGVVNVPITPNISGFHVDRRVSQNSWVAERTEGASPIRDETSSETSTIEIQLTSQKISFQKGQDKVIEPPFAERVANFNSEQQTLFLQNMLKNTATMSGPALSGTVSSATAQGYLPQYRGSAVASLSPVMLDVTGLEREMAQSAAHTGTFRDTNTSNVNKAVVAVLTENCPLNRAIPIIRPVVETLDAEAYMRQLQQKADIDMTSHGWNLNTTGTGPVRGADW